MIKTAAWIHNTDVNKTGISRLTLITREAVDIPELIKETEGRDSPTDAEETNKTMENLRTDKMIDKGLHEKENQETDETKAAAVMNTITNKQDIMADNKVNVNEELLDYKDGLEARADATIEEGNEKTSSVQFYLCLCLA